MPETEGMIDVRQLLRKYTLEQLNRTADGYFEQFRTPDEVGRLLAKPFGNMGDAPPVLMSLGVLLDGLHLAPDLTVLDFGAGPCWIARALTQMGCKVIAADVSPRALAMGRKGFELFPVQGRHHKPEFLLFDGRRLDLPDGSVDRVICFDAFHHVPNQAEALAELARVLRVGGIAGFSEPGPTHSMSERSQRAMREHTVVENDIVLEEIWPIAQKVGFSDLRLAYFTPRVTQMTMQEYYGHVVEGGPMPAPYAQHLQALTRLRRMFYLYRYPPGVMPSRAGEGLRGELRVEVASARVRPGTPIEVHARARNAGQAVWLQACSPVGRVNVGIRSQVGSGPMVEHNRLFFPPSPRCGVFPGEEVAARGVIRGLPPGRHRLTFDLVCEGVCWFADVGGRAVQVQVDVA